MDDRIDVTVPMEEEKVEEIHDRLSYGDSRAEWIRETIQMRLDRQVEVEVGFEEEIVDAMRIHAMRSDESVRDFMLETIRMRLAHEHPDLDVDELEPRLGLKSAAVDGLEQSEPDE